MIDGKGKELETEKKVMAEQTEIKIKNVKILLSWISDLIAGKKGDTPLSFLEAVDKLGLREMMDKE